MAKPFDLAPQIARERKLTMLGTTLGGSFPVADARDFAALLDAIDAADAQSTRARTDSFRADRTAAA